MKKWTIRNIVVLFPNEWNKDMVMAWVNANYIRVCPICNKIDVSYDHFNKCNPTELYIREINNYYKD